MSKYEVVERLRYLDHSPFDTKGLTLDQQLHSYMVIKKAEKVSMILFIILWFGGFYLLVYLFQGIFNQITNWVDTDNLIAIGISYIVN